MILFSIGLPSAFAEWCDAVILAAAGRRAGGADFAAVNTLEELALAALRMQTALLAVGSRQPDSRLCKALTENGRRFVLALPKPRTAVADMIAVHGYDLPGAVRAVASSSGTIRRLAGHPGGLVLWAADEGGTQPEMARAMCVHLNIAVSDKSIRQIVADLASGSVAQAEQDRELWWSGLSEGDRNLVSDALDGFTNTSNDHSGSFSWGPQLFYLGDAPTDSPVGPIDMTGRARCLMYGPFIIVPPGYWNVHVALACSKEAGGAGLIVEAFAGAPLAQVTVHAPAGGGIFDANLAFVIQDGDASADQPFQVRIFNERAIFDGRLGLGKVTLTLQTRAKAEVGQELAVSLGLEAS